MPPTEVTRLSAMLQAPVLGYRRGRGVLDSRNPLASRCRSGTKCGARPTWCSAVGTRMLHPAHGSGASTRISRSSASMPIPKSRSAPRKPAVALIGDAAPILRRLLDALPAHNAKRKSRKAEMEERQARAGESAWRKLAPQLAIPRGDPRRIAGGRHFRRRGDADRLCRAARACRSTSRARSSRPAIRTISAGASPPRSARRTRGATCRCCRSPATAASCTPRTSWRPRCATAFRWSTIVFADGSFGNVRRIQQEELRQPADRERSRQSGFRQIRRELRRRGRARAHARRNCAARCGAASRGATGRP